MSPAGYLAAGTVQSVMTVAAVNLASTSISWTAEGRINTATTKYEHINQRNQDFVDKALPLIIKKHPNEAICKGTEKTNQALDRYEPPNSRTD